MGMNKANTVPGIRTDRPISEADWTDDEQPKVTVLVQTYNHGPYVEQCLESVLMQEAPFRVQVLVHDDASTDGTAEIVESFERKFPRVIQAVCQAENQYSQDRAAEDFLLPLATGEYIAFVEGDDYWTDKHKLVRQVEALDSHPEQDLCVHKALLINCETGAEFLFGVHGRCDRIVPLEELIQQKHGATPTASTMLRRSSMAEQYAFTSTRPWLTVGDIYMHFFGAKRGGAVYLDRQMSAYRHMVPGSWNSRIAASQSERIRHVRAVVDSYIELDALTGYEFKEAFRKAVLGRLDYLFWGSERLSYRMRIKLYFEYRHVLSKRYALILMPLPVLRLFASVFRGSLRQWTSGSRVVDKG